jgi:hypothetical protein
MLPVLCKQEGDRHFLNFETKKVSSNFKAMENLPQMHIFLSEEAKKLSSVPDERVIHLKWCHKKFIFVPWDHFMATTGQIFCQSEIFFKTSACYQIVKNDKEIHLKYLFKDTRLVVAM